MPTYQEMAAQLVGEIPGLPFLFARNYLSQALDEIARERLWSWNVNEGMIIAPQVITTGSVAVTQYSNSITCDATAQAVLNPQTLINPVLTERQFRKGGGPVYNLVAYDSGTGIGTLDRNYMEATDAASTYLIYKCYYGPPTL